MALYFNLSVSLHTLCALVLLTETKICSVQDIGLQPDFQPIKFAGKWYEMYYHGKSYYNISDTWQDITEVYTLTDSGSFTVDVHARTPTQQDQCLFRNNTVLPTGENSKYLLDLGTVYKDYWIISTDFTGYAIVYGCHNISLEGVCGMTDRLDLWVYSRKPLLTDDQRLQIDKILRNICVDPEKIWHTVQNRGKDCGLTAYN